MHEYSAWMRKWAWAISLVLAIIGTGLILPLFVNAVDLRLLWVLPLGWVIFYFVLRRSPKGP